MKLTKSHSLRGFCHILPWVRALPPSNQRTLTLPVGQWPAGWIRTEMRLVSTGRFTIHNHQTRVGKQPGLFTNPPSPGGFLKKTPGFIGENAGFMGKMRFFYNLLVSYIFSVSLLILYRYYLNLVILLCPQFHLYFSYLLIILENLREKYKKLSRHASLLLGKRSFPEIDFKSSLYQHCSPIF